MEQCRTFEEVADLYDAVRPGVSEPARSDRRAFVDGHRSVIADLGGEVVRTHATVLVAATRSAGFRRRP